MLKSTVLLLKYYAVLVTKRNEVWAWLEFVIQMMTMDLFLVEQNRH